MRQACHSSRDAHRHMNEMIEILRMLIATLILGGLSWFLGRTVIKGIRTGAIHHTDSARVCKRRQNPVGFWALVLLFSGFILVFVTLWVNVVIDVLKRLK